MRTGTQKRSAFSLLEVSIAMLLGMFLMLAVFETFFVAARYRMLVGENHASGLALSNAVRDLSSDFAAITSELQKPPQPQRPATRNSSTLRSKLLAQPFNLQDSFASSASTEWTEFVGKRDYVAFRTKAWNSRFTRTPANVTGSGESLVVWWIYRGSSPRIEGWRSGELPIVRSLKVPDKASGLIRTQFFIDANGKEVETSQVILPEARDLKLQYFVEGALLDNWELASQGQVAEEQVGDRQDAKPPLPMAIKVLLAVGQQEDRARSEHWITLPAH